MNQNNQFPQGTEMEVCIDIAARQEHGFKKYGTTVRDNPLSLKQWLQHAYEETLDKAIYLKRAIEEIEYFEKQDPMLNVKTCEVCETCYQGDKCPNCV